MKHAINAFTLHFIIQHLFIGRSFYLCTRICCLYDMSHCTSTVTVTVSAALEMWHSPQYCLTRLGCCHQMLPKYCWSFPDGASGKEPACQCRRCRFNPWVRRIPWRRKWQPIPVFLPGKSQGRWRLVGHSPRVHKESNLTEVA